MSLPVALLRAAGGIALTLFGARLLVDAAIELATLWGVPGAVIGLTVVAVGTSLPELVTSVVAVLRRQGALAFGNVVGSNIYNILGILGLTALIHPIPVPPQATGRRRERLGDDRRHRRAGRGRRDRVAGGGWRVRRSEGVALLFAYAFYIGGLAIST